MPRFLLPTKKYQLTFKYQGKGHQVIGIGDGQTPPDELLADYLHANSMLQRIVDAEGDTSEQSIGDVLAKYGYTDIRVQWLD